eukprot:9484919-Pyramimonas_sp.AAC.1
MASENLDELGPSGTLLAMSIDALVSAHDSMEREPRQMDTDAAIRLQNALVRFLHVWQAFGGHENLLRFMGTLGSIGPMQTKTKTD